jgi:hypothetical protein
MFTYGIIDENGVIQSTTTSEVRIQDRLYVFLSAEPDFDASGYIGRQWTKPQPVGTKITRLAMRNRFTFAEKVAIETAAQSSASIKVYLDDLAASTFVDLSRPDTQAGVQLLESEGIIATGRASEILTNPVTADEVPQ